MTPEERRAQLAAELDTLLDAVVSIGPHSQRDADAGAPALSSPSWSAS